MLRIIETLQPSVALVIATFADVPYVHLALESWRHNHPETAVLVHDDGSHQAETLHGLCPRYGARFFSNPRRMRRTIGDLSAFLHGMEWASGLGSALLVKMSRRFIPLVDWVPELQQLAWSTQYATYSQLCRHFDFGFRTECLTLDRFFTLTQTEIAGLAWVLALLVSSTTQYEAPVSLQNISGLRVCAAIRRS